MTNVVTAPDSIQPATVNFSDLMSKAMAHPSGNDSPDPAPPAPVVASTPVPVDNGFKVDGPTTVPPIVDTVAAPANLTPAEQKILDLPADAKVRVKVDGREELLSVSDFQNGLSREAVFTKRMQGLAEQRKDAETQIAAQYAALQLQAQALEMAKANVFQPRQQFQTPAAPAPISQDPGELATLGEVNSAIAAYTARLDEQYKAREAQFVQAIGQASTEVQERVTLQRDAAAYNVGLQSVMDRPDFAALKKAIPYAEESIRYQVAAMDPQTIPEAISFTEQVAKEWMGNLRTSLADVQQRQEVAKAHAKLEPPSGSPPAPAPAYKPGSAFGKDGKFDWNALAARAATMIG